MMKINQQALATTKTLCHRELDQMSLKYNTCHYQIFKRYLRKDFQFLLWFSLIGMILILISSYQNIDLSITTLIIFYGLLGALAIFQYLKSDYYHTKDLISVSYLNQSRCFLYSTYLFTLFELFNFIIISFLIPFDAQILIMTVLCTLVPIFISQAIAMIFINYISNLITVFIAYLISYLSVTMMFRLIDFQAFIGNRMCTLLVVTVFVIYILSVIMTFKQKKRRKEIWNWY